MKTLNQHHLTQKKTYLNINTVENYEHILNICEKYFYTALGFSQEDLKITLEHDKFYSHIKEEDKKVIKNLLNFMILQKIDYFNFNHGNKDNFLDNNKIDYFNFNHEDNDNFLDNNKGEINVKIYKH
jgi:hypothetical protein